MRRYLANWLSIDTCSECNGVGCAKCWYLGNKLIIWGAECEWSRAAFDALHVYMHPGEEPPEPGSIK